MKTKPQTFMRKIGAAKGFFTGMAAAFMMFMRTLPAYAEDIGSSKLATGTEKLVTDITTWLLVIAPLVAVVAVIYYFIRKTVSDEMDHKRWNTRISTAIISCIGVVTASIIIKVIIAYYQ